MKRLVFCYCIVVLAACSATSEVTAPYEPSIAEADAAKFAAEAKFRVNDPVTNIPPTLEQPEEKYLTTLATLVRSNLEAENRLASDEGSALSIDIEINEFRMRNVGTRYMFGALAGKDGIASEVTVRDASGEVLGSFIVSSYNVSAYGREAAVRMHADEIAKRILDRLAEAQATGR